MTESLMGSLGLDNISADPNALPDGKWAGEVVKSEYVHIKAKDSVAHVITYRVTQGERTGAERAEFWNIGTGPKFDEANNIVGITTPTMSDKQKPWYKKRFVDLGIPEGAVASAHPRDLVGKEVIFGTKKNGEYINVSFVELRGNSLLQSQALNGQAAVAQAAAPVTAENLI